MKGTVGFFPLLCTAAPGPATRSWPKMESLGVRRAKQVYTVLVFVLIVLEIVRKKNFMVPCEVSVYAM